MTDTDNTEYQVLARKYRPGNLSGLIGQEMLVRTLTNAIENGRIPHAFILTGIRGIGKTSTARIIARSLICTGEKGDLDSPTTEPCGVCENCLAIAEDRHVDILEMDAASRTGVGDIREIIENVSYKPVTARYKIYIIDEVHMLSKSAFNALLKTLEEPPEHTKFIFATTEIRKIPVTILSRCMRFDLSRVDAEDLSKHLDAISKKEGVSVDEKALSLIAYNAEGSVRDALSLLDQAIGTWRSQDTIGYEQVQQMLGVADRSNIFDLFDSIIKGKAKESIEQLQAIYKAGADPITLLQDLLELSHFVTKLKVVADGEGQSHVSEEEQKRAKEFADSLSLPFLARVWQMLLKGISEAQIAVNPLAAAEMIIIRLSYSSNLPTPGDLVKDIEKGDSDSKNMGAITNPVNSPEPPAHVMKAPSPSQNSETDGVEPNPTSFKELVEMFEKKEENFVCSWLQDVNLVDFDAKAKKLEFRPSSLTPQGFAGKVSGLLSQWTGNRWIVIVSNESGEKSLREESEERLDSLKAEAKEDRLVKQILNTFPESKITKMEEVIDEDDAEEDSNTSLAVKSGEQ